MSDPNQPAEGQQPAVDYETPGQRLRRARESHGLDIAQICTQLNIGKRHIVALEEDDYDRLPGVAFVRGYLRSYSRLLGLDGDALVDSFNRLQGEEPVRQVASVTKVRRQASLSDPLVRGVAFVLLLALVGFSVWWWQAQTQPLPTPPLNPAAEQAAPEQESATEAIAPEAPVETAGGDSVASEQEPVYLSEEEVARLAAELEQAEQPATSEQPATREQSPAAKVEQPTATDDVAVATAPAVLKQLTVSFIDECWVTLKSAEGRTLVARIFNSGETLEIDVPVPAELLIGKVSAVSSVEFGGAPLPLAERARQNVARITLDAP